jgi:AAA+ ATPase superfamily predicted ATPase
VQKNIEFSSIKYSNTIKAPFRVGKPVEDEYFIDREEIMEQMKVHAKAMNNTCLLGLRRMGKTSIIYKVIKEMKDPIPVYINCYGSPGKSYLGAQILEQVKDAYIGITGDRRYREQIKKGLKAITDRVGDFISRIRDVDVSVADYVSIKVRLEEAKEDPEELLRISLNYAENLGKRKGKRFVIFLDEIQDVGSRWGGDFMKRLRTIVEAQRYVCYVFSGSSITFMNSLVDDPEAPFYRQLFKIRVGSLPEDDVRQYIKRRLGLFSCPISRDAVERTLELTHSIPDYVQRIGCIACRSTPITKEQIERSYERLLADLDSEFRETISKLNERSEIYAQMLSGLSRSDSLSDLSMFIRRPMYGFMRQVNYLQQVGLIEKVGRGRYEIADPIFKDWLRENL